MHCNLCVINLLTSDSGRRSFLRIWNFHFLGHFYNLTGRREDDALADVTDTIGRAFQIVRCPEQVCGLVHNAGVGYNLGDELFVDVIV